MKYISRPTIIEAEQHLNLAGKPDIVPESHWNRGSVCDKDQVYDELHDSWINVEVGNYVIKGTRGEFYPCIESVFLEKYEKFEGF